MNSDILFFFGEHMDALPLYERLIISREKNREFTIWKLPVQRRKPFNSQLETVRFPVQDEADAG